MVRWRISKSRARCIISADLLRRFYRYEAHRWTPNRLADRLGIGHVVLVAFHISFHIVGWHQASFMAKRNQLTSPMVRRRAGFEVDKARRNLGKEREDLAASQPLAHHYAAHLVHRMNLEDTLCQIKTNCCNIAHGWLPLLISNDHHPGTSMPSGGHPPHQLEALFDRKKNPPARTGGLNAHQRL
jgi:hypothetical protein